MTKREALALFNFSESALLTDYTATKKAAKKKLASLHPDNGNEGTEEFILLHRAYMLLFRNSKEEFNVSEVKAPGRQGFKFSKPKQRKTVTLETLKNYKYRNDIEVVVEIPIEFNNCTTMLYIKYVDGQQLYAKSLVLPQGAKTMLINGKQYILGKGNKYIINLVEFKLELDIYFERG